MRVFDERYSPEGVALQMRREALTGRFTGNDKPHFMDYIRRCTAYHEPTRTHIVFDREEGCIEAGSGTAPWTAASPSS